MSYHLIVSLIGTYKTALIFFYLYKDKVCHGIVHNLRHLCATL